MAGADELNIAYADTAVAYGTWRNILIQVRRGELTAERVQRMEAVFRRARLEVKGPAMLIGLLEPDAPVASATVRKLQTELLRAASNDPRHHFSVVIEGESLTTHLQRTIIRGVLVATPRVRVAASVSDALPFIHDITRQPTTAVARVVESVRAAILPAG